MIRKARGWMKKNLLLGIILTFNMILPVHALEYAVESGNTQGMTEGWSENTVSGNDFTSQEDYYQIVSDIAKENEYDIYQKQLKAQLCSQQMEYLSALYLQRKEEYDIAEVKFALGYVTETEVKEAETQMKTVELQMDTAEAQLEFFKECIQLKGGEYQNDFLEEELPQLTKDYMTIFLEKNDQIKYYNQQVQQYEEALNDIVTDEARQKVNEQITILKLNRQTEIRT